MRFFEELTSKILWFVLGLILLSFGYIFVIINFLNPPKLLIGAGYVAILNIWLKPKTNQIITNPTIVNTSPNPTPTTITNNPQTKQTKEDLISALAQAEEIEIINPQELVRGGIHKIHAGLTPERSTGYESALTQEFKFHNVNKTQEIAGFFEVPKTGYYHFKVFGTKPELGNTDTRLRVRVNGAKVHNENRSIYLQQGWHALNF